MPIDLPSRWGVIPPDVQTYLRRLTDAVNSLEPLASRVPAADARVSTADTRIAELSDELAALRQQVTAITPRAEEASETPIEGQPSPPTTPGPGGGGTPPLGTIGAGSAAPTVPLPDLYSIVAGYANAHPAELANSCLEAGGSWNFMDGVVAALMAADPRVGFNGKRGNTSDPSQDAVSYYHGLMPPVAGSPNVYVVDIIGGHCPAPGGTAVPAWSNVTTPRAAGAYMATR